MESHDVSMRESLKRLEEIQLHIDTKDDRRHRRTRRERMHSSSFAQDVRDMEIFYKESHERRKI